MSERVDDSDLVEAMGLALLRGGANATKAPSQIAFSVCPACKVARQNAAGVEFAVSPAVFERAACDAVWLGNYGRAEGARRPGHHARPARIRARTRSPSLPCAGLPVGAQHRRPSHRASRAGRLARSGKSIALCAGHHAAHHDGRLTVRGTADALEVVRLDDNFHVENSDEKSSEVTTMQAEAVLALTGLGFKKRDASCAVAAAVEKDEPQDLDGLVRSALKRCGS